MAERLNKNAVSAGPNEYASELKPHLRAKVDKAGKILNSKESKWRDGYSTSIDTPHGQSDMQGKNYYKIKKTKTGFSIGFKTITKQNYTDGPYVYEFDNQGKLISLNGKISSKMNYGSQQAEEATTRFLKGIPDFIQKMEIDRMPMV